MPKIWAKLMIEGKIVRQYTYNLSGKVVYSAFFKYLTEICDKLDIATPLLLKTHIFNFAKFRQARFYKADFVEKFDFDFLVLEYITV